MKLLLVSQYYEPAWDYGGPATKVTAISRHLSERGHEVDVLTSSVAGPLRNGVGAPGTTRHGSLTVHYLPAVFRFHGLTVNPGVSPFCRQHLRRFDLVHIFGVYDWLGTMAYRAVRAQRKPYVLEPLGMYGLKGRGPGRKWLYRRLVAGDLFRGAGRVIATSEAEFEQLRATGVTRNGNVIIRRNGVDSQADVGRGVSLVKDARTILFLGRLMPVKNLELLIDAFAGLGLDDVHLVIAGPRPDAEYARRLEERASKADPRGRIHFHDAVQGEEKAALLRGAHVAVLSSRFESYGNAIAEAVTAGVPVVVTDGCGVAPIVRDRVGLVAEQNVDAFRAALRQLLETPAMYERFRSACADVKREFSWDEPIDMLERIYTEVVSSES